MLPLVRIALWSILVLHCPALPLVAANSTQLRKPVILHQFPNGTWVENIATLASGRMIVSLLNAADLVLIDPKKRGRVQTIFHDTAHTGILGLAQPDNNTLAAVVGNFSTVTQSGTAGSYGISLFTLQWNGSVTLRSTFPVPGAQMLDGLTNIPGNSDYVLAADPKLGVVWRVDLRSGKSNLAFNSTLLQPSPGIAGAAVNGVHARGGYLYFTNSNKRSFGRIPMTIDGMPTQGLNTLGEMLVQDFSGATYDDFALGPANSSIYYLCSPTGFAINRFDSSQSKQTVFAGGSADTRFDHPIAAQLGKSRGDSHVLYVTTAGIIPGVGGSGGGQVFAVDTTA